VTSEQAVRIAAQAALDKKASDLVLLDVRDRTSLADFFLIASGTNQKQLVAVCEAIQARLRDEGVRPGHVEGYPRQEWILLDYSSFVIHVFTEATRSYYDLERLWGEARRIEVGP
jgi:ribosome-associated protein